MACIGTWTFSLAAVESCAEQIQGNQISLDSLIHGVNVVEEDPSTGVYLVGRGSYPNSEGTVQLDAAVMDGKNLHFGSVCSLEGYSKPISVARCVMEKCKHSMLVGSGARKFAHDMGFVAEPNDSLMTDETKTAYERYKLSSQSVDQVAHDTLAVLCLDKMGNVTAGVSTSGPPFKAPGRVGDSPLPGCGLYADNTAGAAAVTGDGDIMMRYCPSYHIVRLMREGAAVQDACDKVVTEMKERHGAPFEAAAIALNVKGEVGASSLLTEWIDVRNKKVYNGFPYSVWQLGKTPTIQTKQCNVMNSIDSDCTPLKKQYDDCFNAWFKEYFLRGRGTEVTHEAACGSLFTKYLACLQKTLQERKFDLQELHENIIGTDKEKNVNK